MGSTLDTRPYRYDEFDILAVNMHPSTNKWDKFLYTVVNWLLPAKNNHGLLLKFQPVPKGPTDTWTDNFEECVDWFRSGRRT